MIWFKLFEIIASIRRRVTNESFVSLRWWRASGDWHWTRESRHAESSTRGALRGVTSRCSRARTRFFQGGRGKYYFALAFAMSKFKNRIRSWCAILITAIMNYVFATWTYYLLTFSSHLCDRTWFLENCARGFCSLARRRNRKGHVVLSGSSKWVNIFPLSLFSRWCYCWSPSQLGVPVVDDLDSDWTVVDECLDRAPCVPGIRVTRRPNVAA